MKPITRFTTALLSGLLLLLGFGGCQSSRRAARKAAEKAEQEEQARQDSINKAYGPDRPILKPDDPGRIRVLYGPPPTRFRKNLDK